MSAPATHDPRFVNTRDGVCWEQRAVTEDGRGLYAVEGSCKCPPFKMATLAELAERGIVGSAHVVTAPMGPGRAVLRELASAFDADVKTENERLKARIAELEAERRRYVGAEPTIAEEMAYLSRCLDSVLAFCDEQDKAARLFELPTPEWIVRVRAAADGLVERASYPPALPWAALMDDEDRAEFLDELADAATTNADSGLRLAEVERACGTWRLIAEAQHGHNTAPGPDAVTQTFAPVAALREPNGIEAPCSKCGDPVHWVASSNSDGGFWRHSYVPGRVLDHFGVVAGSEGRHAFEKEYQGVSDAKRRLANCKHCGQGRGAPMHPELEGEFHGFLHHANRTSHDIPGGGA